MFEHLSHLVKYPPLLNSGTLVSNIYVFESIPNPALQALHLNESF